MLRELFLKHPRSVGEGYFAHMGMAFSFGGTMLMYGFVCLIHGIFPFLFEKTGSRAITELYRRMTVDRDRRDNSTSQAPVAATMATNSDTNG